MYKLPPDVDMKFILESEFPHFAKLETTDFDDGVYCVLGSFGIYLCEECSKIFVNKEVLTKAFDILNAMGESDDIEIQNQLIVGVLEMLIDTKLSIHVARENLKGNSLEFFERVIRGWGKPELR